MSWKDASVGRRLGGKHKTEMVTFWKPMSRACSRKQRRQVMRWYLRMRPWVLPQIRLARGQQEPRQAGSGTNQEREPGPNLRGWVNQVFGMLKGCCRRDNKDQAEEGSVRRNRETEWSKGSTHTAQSDGDGYGAERKERIRHVREANERGLGRSTILP